MKLPLVADASRHSYGNSTSVALALGLPAPGYGGALMLRLAALALALPFLIPAARADDIADFYRGKELRLIVSASIGGGYDIYARAVARHLGAHIPGNPTIVPQNMPAAGGLGAANHLNNVAAK